MRDGRRLDIQGLRAIAVLMVVLFHAGLPVPGGFVGVDVFFVISGFVITGMLHREWLTNGRIRFRAFYARRFKRLTPALALMVSVTLMLTFAFQSPLGTQQTAAQTGIGAMVLVANFVIARTTGGYFDAAAEANPLLNTWSLSVEEQFYLVFPLVLVLGWLIARGRGARWPLVIVGLVTLASFGLVLVSARGGQVPVLPTDFVGFYSPLTRAWEFGAGALLALTLASGRAQTLTKGESTALGAAGLTLIIASLWIMSAGTPGPGLRNLVPVVGTVLLLRAGTNPDAPITRALSTRPFVALGDLSYSWYLWHWPLIVFALLLWPTTTLIAPLAALLSLIPAIASYRWVEQPIRLSASRGKAAWTRLIGIVVLPPIAIALVILYLCNVGYWSATVREYQSARQSHADTATGCVDTPADATLPPDHCVWNPSASGPPIYLLGDSNAGHFSEAVIGAGEKLGRPVHIYAVHGCPFMDSAAFASSADDPGDCARYVDRTLNWLSQQPEGTVLLGSSSTPWAPADRAAAGIQESGGPGPDTAYLADALGSSVAKLQAAGHEVGLLQVLPHFSREPYLLDYGTCSPWRIINGGCTTSMPKAFADDMQRATITAYEQAAVTTGASLLDFRSTLCADGVCTSQLDGIPVYLDGGHISAAMSAGLAEDLALYLESTQK